VDADFGARFALYDFDIDAGLADDYAHLRERQRARTRARERARVADYNGERGLSSHMAHVRR
jgi:hypothetical protein